MLRDPDLAGATRSARVSRAVLPLTGAALFMVVLDNLIVASTLPSIRSSLHGSLDSLAWVLNAYILAFAVLMLSAAALGERLGRRRVFTARRATGERSARRIEDERLVGRIRPLHAAD